LNDLRIDSHDGSEVHNRVITGLLPQINQNQDERPYIRIGIQLQAFPSHALQDAVQETAVRIQEIEHQNTNQNLRNEIRQEQDGLGYLLKPFALKFVQQNCHKHSQE